MLLWVYYSSEIFLLGAEFTRAYSVRHGSRSDLAPIVNTLSAREGELTSLPPQDARPSGLTILVLLAVAWTSATLTELTMRPPRPRHPSRKT
jgi:membrane protein